MVMVAPSGPLGAIQLKFQLTCAPLKFLAPRCSTVFSISGIGRTYIIRIFGQVSGIVVIWRQKHSPVESLLEPEFPRVALIVKVAA